MKKTILCVLLVLVFILSGCAPKFGVETGEEVNVQLDKQTQAVLRVGCSNTQYEVLKNVIAAFNEEYPNIEVRVMSQPNNDQTIMNWHNSDVQKPGSSPDIFSFSDTDYQAKISILKNLDPYFEAAYETGMLDEDDIAQNMLSRGKSGKGEDKHQYLIGTHYDQFVTYFNTKIFEEAGVELPDMYDPDWTMDVLLEKLDQVNAYARREGLNFRSQMHLDSGALYLSVIYGHGVELFGEGGKVLFNNEENLPKMIDAMEYMQKLTEYSVLSTSDAMLVDGYTPIHFQTKVALEGICNYDKPSKSYPHSGYFSRDLVDMRPFPAIRIEGVDKSYVGAGTFGYSMYRYSKQPNVAWAFLQFMLTPAGQAAFSKGGNHIPMLKSMQEDENAEWRNQPIPGYSQEAFISYPERVISLDYRDYFTTAALVEVELALQKLVTDVINRNDTIEALIEACADKIEYEVSKEQ